jgi:hypothetical protein
MREKGAEVAETTMDKRKPEPAEGEREPEAAAGEREPEPKDLPEPREKSADDLLSRQVVDSHGVTIGEIEALFIDGHDERANWARVKMDFIGTSSAFVPLHDAQEADGQILVVYEKQRVKEAPEIEPDGNELSDDEADALRGHYGLERITGLTVQDDDEIELPRETRDATPPTMKERPWAVEKYPLPDMDRPEGKSMQQDGSSDRDPEERAGG